MTAALAFDEGQSEVCESSADFASWDRYVLSHKDGSFFHLSGWGKIAAAAYGFEPIYLTVKRQGRIAGILPLVEVKSPFFGRSLVSTAFSVGGGPLVDDDEALAALLSDAADIGAKRGVKFVECRSNFDSSANEADANWIERSGTYAGFQLPLLATDEEQLKALPRKRRADLRKAINAEQSGDLVVRHDGSKEEFYDLYAKSLHRLGTPIFPKRFLDSIVDVFDDAVEITVVEHERTPVVALLTFYFGAKAMPYYVGATEDARSLRAFDLIYWSVMRRAVAKGFEVFDFGRSKVDSGPYAYKKNWGAEIEPLVYKALLINTTEAPERNPTNPKFRAFVKLWPTLPLKVTKALGPLLAPNFP